MLSVFPGPGWRCDSAACPLDLELIQYSRTLLIQRINRWGLPLGVCGRKGASVATPTPPVLPGRLGGTLLSRHTSLPGPVVIILLSRACNFALNKQSGFLFRARFLCPRRRFSRFPAGNLWPFSLLN